MSTNTKKSPSDVDQYIGRQIRYRRVAVQMSQEKLGEALGLTFQQVQKYERGRNRVGAARLQNIAHVLGVSIGYFFPGDHRTAEYSDSIDRLPAPTERDRLLKLVEAFLAIKEENVRRNLVNLVEEISRL